VNQAPAQDYSNCDMTTLHRLIKYRWDQAAFEQWRKHYGHDYPVYAVVKGEEVRYQE